MRGIFGFLKGGRIKKSQKEYFFMDGPAGKQNLIIAPFYRDYRGEYPQVQKWLAFLESNFPDYVDQDAGIRVIRQCIDKKPFLECHPLESPK